MCKNDEDDKYLLTFQNFNKNTKMSQTIVDDETKRIVETSKCLFRRLAYLRLYYTT